MNDLAQDSPAIVAFVYMVVICLCLGVCINLGDKIDEKLKAKEVKAKALLARSEKLQHWAADLEGRVAKMREDWSKEQEEAHRAGLKAELENKPFEAIQMCPFCDHIDFHHIQSRGEQVINRECTKCGKDWQNLA